MSTINLDLRESGTLCHVLMARILESGGLEKQPPWVLQLYEKLAIANNEERGEKI